jgi:hypothetical protein
MIALLLGAAAYQGSRRAIAAELAFVIARALTSPRQATQVASRAVARFSITPDTIERVAAAAAGDDAWCERPSTCWIHVGRVLLTAEEVLDQMMGRGDPKDNPLPKEHR